jgi:ketosteroid isomerase-like protein
LFRRAALALTVLLAALPARAGTDADIRAAYAAFVADQNARDPVRIGQHFIDGADLLWVSDGRSFWGREAILARMSGFQKAEVWRVEPDLDRARVVEIGAETALINLPLTLVIGSAATPDRLPWLVSLVWVRREAGWKIAALLTTTAKP